MSFLKNMIYFLGYFRYCGSDSQTSIINNGKNPYLKTWVDGAKSRDMTSVLQINSTCVLWERNLKISISSSSGELLSFQLVTSK